MLVLVVGGMAGRWSVDARAKTARVPGECEVLDVLEHYPFVIFCLPYEVKCSIQVCQCRGFDWKVMEVWVMWIE